MDNNFVTLKELIKKIEVDFASNIAFKVKKKDEEGKKYYDEITYSRFGSEIEYLARSLMDMGLSGKKIAVIGKNSYEWILTFLASVCAGSVIVPLDRSLLDHELKDQLERSGASALFYGDNYEDRVGEYNVVKVCTDSEDFKNLIEKGKELPNKDEYEKIIHKPDILSVLLFTSGTTSASKAVMLSQRNITSNIRSMRLWEKLYETDVNMALLPFHHTFGMVQTLLFLSFGMCNVFCEGLRIAKCLKEYGVTIFVGVPRIIEEMKLTIDRTLEKQNKTKTVKFAVGLSNVLRKFGIDKRRKLFSQIIDALGGRLRLIIIGAAAASPEVLKFFNDIGILSIQGYGLTETSPVLSAENDTHMRKNSVGPAIPGVEVRIDSPDANGIGEIIAKGENIMLGYYNDKENTDSMIKGGWLYTGDMGKMDKDGYIYILGRKKNVIVLSNGKNVFPEEIETWINLSPAIKECVVYGEGDTIKCKIVTDENFEGDAKAAIETHMKEVNEKFIYYKRVAEYTIQEEEMAKTSTGKIKRYVK